MFHRLVLALALGQVHGLVLDRAAAPTDGDNTIPMYVKDGKTGVFKPYQPFNYPDWVPDVSLYDELPMIGTTMTVDGKELVYQDFNISALSLEQFKQHFMNLPQFLDANGNFVPSTDEVKAYQDSLIAQQEDSNTALAIPERLSKRAFPDACYYDDRLHCSSSCINLVSRGVRQSVNNDVYGYYHFVSDPQCGVGSITKTVSVTHVSGVTLGGTAQIPGFGKGWTQAVSTFFNTFGFSIGHSPDSVTTGISYSGTCGPFNVCFLWERPHFRVDKGVIVTQHIDVNTQRACSNPTVTPYEAHIMHTESDAGGATSHGICYSMANHGCGNRVDASNSMQRCPDNY